MELKHIVTYESEHTSTIICRCGEQFIGYTMAKSIDLYATHILRTTMDEALKSSKDLK